MKVFIANFGRQNLFWPLCLERSVVATYEDEDTWPLWESSNREAYVERCVATKRTARNIAPTRAIASRWFNLSTIVAETCQEIWIHREKNDLWWTVSRADAYAVSREAAPWSPPSAPPVYMIQKAADPWSHVDRRGAALVWPAIHAKAREFLFTEGTIQELSPDNASYAQALLDGADLEPWHARPEWKRRADATGHGAVRTLSARENAIARMARTVEDTVKASLGPPSLQSPKLKEMRFPTAAALREYIAALVEAQEGLCALTELPLQFDGDHDDSELLCSLDRIDSDGHYEPGNLQIVCKFANRWKRDDVDASFRRLLGLVRGVRP